MKDPAHKKKGYISVCGGLKPPPVLPLEVSDKERIALRNGAIADMQKHGFTTVEELTAYYDSKRGY